MKTQVRWFVLILLCLPVMMGASDNGCSAEPVSRSGIKAASATVVAKGSDGLTVEQRNIRDRMSMDSKVGSIKHLYIISAYSGQVLIYSTVRGKVTSSGKRLSPKTVNGRGDNNWGFAVDFGGSTQYTNEVLEDDGSYGDSIPYLYWFDSKGIYHQHYPEGGQIIHVSDQPIAVKSIVLNMEVSPAQP